MSAVATGPALDLLSRWQVCTAVETGPDGLVVLEHAGEQVAGVYGGVRVVLADDVDVGPGTLTITSRRIVWVATASTSVAISFNYYQIAMHAVCRDQDAFPAPCVYLQLDETDEDPGATSDGEDEYVPAEIRLIPEDELSLQSIFDNLCLCSTQNPDPDMEEEGQAELFVNEDEVLAGLAPEARAALLNNQFEVNIGLVDHGAALEDGVEDSEDDLEELVGGDADRFHDDEDQEEEEGNGGSQKQENGLQRHVL